MKYKNVYLPCDDNMEIAVFTKYDWYNDKSDYALSIEDAYCGGNNAGIKNRFKRAWYAFWAKPICYADIVCVDKERMKKFLQDCLNIIEE